MTVLFYKDWFDQNGRPRAIVHKETKNDYFLKMAARLKMMGIKNHSFMLCLYDPDLRNVDPHTLDEKTDPDMRLRVKVAKECSRNIWYIIREIVRIESQGGDPVRFELNRSSTAMTWCFLNGIDYIAIQCRQSGKEQPLEAQVLTTHGWVSMGDIRHYHQVLTPDGRCAKVIGIYPQGTKPVYRVTFEDGRSTEVGIDHLWNVQSHNEDHVLGLYDEVDTRYLIDHLDEGFSIPLIQQDLSRLTLDTDAFTLGKSLQNDASLTLKNRYRYESFSAIYSLISGLLDGRDSNTYNTIVKSNVDIVQYCVRSIGGLCRVHEESGIYIAEIDVNRESGLLGITDIEFVGEKECQCIEIDHPDHLYITDDFIVTHNTIAALTLTAIIEYIFGKNITFGMYTKDDDLRTTNINRVKTIRDLFPEYLITRSPDDRDNAKGLFYKALKNTYQTIVAQADMREANKRGRGASAAGWHDDELAFCKNAEITYSAKMSATNRAREDARRHGKPHSIIITTTAGDPSLPEGRFVNDLIDKSFMFTEKLFDFEDLESTKSFIAKNSENEMVTAIFSHIQLGFDNEWLKKIIKRNNIPRDEVARDFLNISTSMASDPLLKEQLDKINRSRRSPSYIEIFDDFGISWYVPQSTVHSTAFKIKPMVLGMDSSDMNGNDYTSFVIVDPSTLEVLGTFHTNEANIFCVGLFLAQLMLRYTKMIFVPENRSTGSSIIDAVSKVLTTEGKNPFQRIYNQIVDEPENPKFRNVNIYDSRLADTEYKRYFGIKTDKKKRAFLYGSTLTRSVGIGAMGIRDAKLIRQLGTLKMINGRIDHASDGNDDAVIAYLMACWFVFNARNFSTYGLNVDDVLARSLDPTETEKNHKEKEQQKTITKLKGIEKLIDSTHDPILKEMHIREYRRIAAQMDTSALSAPETAEQFHKDPTRFLEGRVDNSKRIKSADELLAIADSIF